MDEPLQELLRHESVDPRLPFRRELDEELRRVVEDQEDRPLREVGTPVPLHSVGPSTLLPSRTCLCRRSGSFLSDSVRGFSFSLFPWLTRSHHVRTNSSVLYRVHPCEVRFVFQCLRPCVDRVSFSSGPGSRRLCTGLTVIPGSGRPGTSGVVLRKTTTSSI